MSTASYGNKAPARPLRKNAFLQTAKPAWTLFPYDAAAARVSGSTAPSVAPGSGFSSAPPPSHRGFFRSCPVVAGTLSWGRRQLIATNRHHHSSSLFLTSHAAVLALREGALGDDDSADMDGENGRGFEEYEWAGQKRIRATALLEGGFRVPSSECDRGRPQRCQRAGGSVGSPGPSNLSSSSSLSAGRETRFANLHYTSTPTGSTDFTSASTRPGAIQPAGRVRQSPSPATPDGHSPNPFQHGPSPFDSQTPLGGAASDRSLPKKTASRSGAAGRRSFVARE
ncbi:E3 ubiquitin-protein ligase RNF220 [Liparis tanakae]|uniref:E3 ubiquitin-protein ligase RNF220 n=1 Tax=Liparis tanakae TaxID=230148 RepID=A0A4Z2FZQ2_9TELE|nr:E3 ubiquitin-protein ligase RNF220 [Liparis tanakae]